MTQPSVELHAARSAAAIELRSVSGNAGLLTLHVGSRARSESASCGLARGHVAAAVLRFLVDLARSNPLEVGESMWGRRGIAGRDKCAD